MTPTATSPLLLDSNGIIYRENHKEKVEKRFTPAKRRGRSMARYVQNLAADTPPDEWELGREKLQKLGQELAVCRNHLLFKDHFKEGRVTLSRMVSCKHARLCPLCGIARANKYVVSYGQKIDQLCDTYHSSGAPLDAYFVTLTVKHGVDLATTYDHFHSSVTRLVARFNDAKRGREGSAKHAYALRSVMASVIGGVCSIEVKRGKGSGLWNVHVHCLFLSTDVIDKRRLSEEWRGITKDSYIVDCKRVDPTDRKMLCEILKYSLKFSEMSLKDNLHAAIVLRHHRLLRSFGELYGLKPDRFYDIDDTTILDSPYIEILYSYRKGAYQRKPSDGGVIYPQASMERGGRTKRCTTEGGSV